MAKRRKGTLRFGQGVPSPPIPLDAMIYNVTGNVSCPIGQYITVQGAGPITASGSAPVRADGTSVVLPNDGSFTRAWLSVQTPAPAGGYQFLVQGSGSIGVYVVNIAAGEYDGVQATPSGIWTAGSSLAWLNNGANDLLDVVSFALEFVPVS